MIKIKTTAQRLPFKSGTALPSPDQAPGSLSFLPPIIYKICDSPEQVFVFNDELSITYYFNLITFLYERDVLLIKQFENLFRVIIRNTKAKQRLVCTSLMKLKIIVSEDVGCNIIFDETDRRRIEHISNYIKECSSCVNGQCRVNQR